MGTFALNLARELGPHKGGFRGCYVSGFQGVCVCVCMHAHGVFFDAGSGREFGFHICCVSVLIRFTDLEGLRLTVGALII